MLRLGLKLGSTNSNYIDDAVRFYENGLYDYIELYAVPGSYGEYFHLWKSLRIPIIVHAPHYGNGLNLADIRQREQNSILIEEMLKFADELKSDTIIFHPGVSGVLEETVFQLNLLKDRRVIIENKPVVSLFDGKICNGCSPEEIKYIIENAHAGFCLDIGHAFCSAAARKLEPYEHIVEYLKLNPRMYHLSDGYVNNVIDSHEHLNKGDFDIQRILSLIPANSTVTVETDKDYKDSLIDFEDDVMLLRGMAREYLHGAN